MGRTKLYHGVGLRGVRDVDEAEVVLLEAHRILEPYRDARLEDWYWVNTHLAQLYVSSGREREAVRFQSAVAELSN